MNKFCSTQHVAPVRRKPPTSKRLRQWGVALGLSTLLTGAAQAALFTLDTSGLDGTAARLEINLLDGDGVFGNSTASAFSQSITDPDQILYDFIAGSPISFNLNFQGVGADLLIVNLLDAESNFSLIDTDLGAFDVEVPYQDALLVCEPATGRCFTPTRIDAGVSIAFVPEPGTLALLALVPAMLRQRRRPSSAAGNA